MNNVKAEEKFAYGVLISALVILGLFMFRVFNFSKNSISRPIRDIADSIYDYAKTIESTEKDVAIKCFEYFNEHVVYTKEELQQNKTTVTKLLDDFNTLFVDPDSSILIYDDNTYVCSSNTDDSFLFNLDLRNEKPYADAVKNFGFTITPYNEFEQGKVCYSFPLLDKNNEVIGVIIKTRKLDYLLKKLEEIELSLSQYNIVVETLDDTPFALIDENGISKGSDLEMQDYVNKLISRTKGEVRTFVDNDFGIKYVLVPTNDSTILAFNLSIGCATILTMIVVSLVIYFIVTNKSNFTTNLLLCFIFGTCNLIFFYLVFKPSYTTEMLKKLTVDAAITNLTEENEDEIQEVLVGFTGNSFYNALLNKDLSNENAMLSMKEALTNYIDLDLFKFMSFDDEYLLKGNNIYDLNTTEAKKTNQNYTGLYDLSVRNQKIYDRHIFKDFTAKTCDVIDTYTIKFKSNAIVYALNYDGYAREERSYEDFILNKNIKEVYAATIEDDQLYMAPCKLGSNNKVYKFNELEYVEVDNKKYENVISDFLDSEEKFGRMDIVNSKARKEKALIFKTYNSNTVLICLPELTDLSTAKFKTANIVTGCIMTFGLCFILKKLIENYYANKKESIQLHGNY